MAADDDTTQFEGCDRLPMPMLALMAKGALCTAMMPTMVPNVSRC